MRVAKTDTIAGLPAPAARSLVRLFRGGTFAQEAADNMLSRNGIEDADAAFARMEEAGYLVRVEIDDDRYVWWETTTLGNALAMASFGKPIRRKTAERLGRRNAGACPRIQHRRQKTALRGPAQDFRKLPGPEN
jgi:hypothetical protein